jgi:hypothetical protein
MWRVNLALVVSLLLVAGCPSAPLTGDPADLARQACTGYDTNNDGTTTPQEVMEKFQAVTGETISQADAQDFVTAYCQG